MGEARAKPLSLRELEDAWGGCGRLPLNCSLRVLLLVMSELEKLHALGQVHGELTPEYVMLAEQGSIYLAPPGRVPPHPREKRRRHHFCYLAPEKLQQRAVDARADVFSVGVLLWEALAGTPLLEGSTPQDILARWRTGGAPLAPVRSSLSWARSLSHVAARALAIEPDDRCASVQQLHAAVELLGGAHTAQLDAWSALLRGPLPPELAKSSRPPELAPATLTRAELERRPLRNVSFNGSGRWGNDTIFDVNARPPDLELDPAPSELDRNCRLYYQAPADDYPPTRFLLAPGRLLTPTAFAAEPTLASAHTQPPPLPIATRGADPLPAPQRENRTQRPAWLPVALLALIAGAVLSVIAGGKAPAHADEAVPSPRLAAAPLSPEQGPLDPKSPLTSAVPSQLALAPANSPWSLPPTSAPAVRRSATTQTVPLAGTPAPTGRRRPPQAQRPVGPPDYGI